MSGSGAYSLNNRIIVVVVIILLIADVVTGFFGMASSTGTVHQWSEIGVIPTFSVGGTSQVFNSTCGGPNGRSTGVGLNLTLPSPGWGLPFTVPQGGLPLVALLVEGWITISIGSPNSTSLVIMGPEVVASTVGIPAVCTAGPASDDGLRFSFVSRFGPANPTHRSVATGTACAGTTCSQRDTIPLNGYVEAGCNPSGQCFNPGITVFIYIAMACAAFFTGPGFGTANSCAFWGKGANGWDLGNATITGGKLQVFA